MPKYKMTKKDAYENIKNPGDFFYSRESDSTHFSVVVPWKKGFLRVTEEIAQYSDRLWPWIGEEHEPTINHSLHFKNGLNCTIVAGVLTIY